MGLGLEVLWVRGALVAWPDPGSGGVSPLGFQTQAFLSAQGMVVEATRAESKKQTLCDGGRPALARANASRLAATEVPAAAFVFFVLMFFI